MRHWKLLGRADIPDDGGELRLYQGGEEFSLRADGNELMNNRVHASEDALGSLACRCLRDSKRPRVLIGGLGMGYTLAAVLKGLGPGARVTVGELVPEVVEWNRGPLGPLAGRPLDDPRVGVRVGDVLAMIREEAEAYDAVLLDVDNTPASLTRKVNDGLYSEKGLEDSAAALRPGGVYGLWSAGPDKRFLKRLRKAGFSVAEHPVRGRDAHRGGHHIVWIAVKPEPEGDARGFRRVC